MCHTYLTEQNLASIEPEEARRLFVNDTDGNVTDSGNEAKPILIDVRLKESYDAEHALGAVNVPLFREVQGNGFFDTLKRVAMGGFAMKATERDPDFIGNLKKMIGSEEKTVPLIVMCSIGGTLDTMIRRPGRKPYADPDRSFGRESRSLKACYEIMMAGYSNVKHVSGGLQVWRKEGLPMGP